MKVLKAVLLIILVGFIAVQFIRPEKFNDSKEPVSDIAMVLTVPSSVHQSLKDACYDCHSNNTNYIWYFNIQPVGLMMNKHIMEGREELNFSNFKINPDKMKEIAEVIEEDEMPLKSYRMLHKKARLDDTQKQELIQWAESETLIR
jgi:Haem-binding domain